MLETEVKKLAEAVIGLTQVLANAAIGSAPVPEKTVPTKEPEKKSVTDDILGGPDGGGKTEKELVADYAADAAKGLIAKYAPAASLSADEIRARLTPIIQAEGPDCVSGALVEIGVSMLTELTPEQYPALLAKVHTALGKEV